MADYIPILDSEIEPDAPLKADLAARWRDNPLAIAQGAAGAPRVVRGALSTTTTTISGAFPAGGGFVRIALPQYSFFPDVKGQGSYNFVTTTGVASGSTPGFSLQGGGVSASYDVIVRSILA